MGSTARCQSSKRSRAAWRRCERRIGTTPRPSPAAADPDRGGNSAPFPAAQSRPPGANATESSARSDWLGEPHALDISTASSRIRNGTLSSLALTESCLAQIERWNRTLNAFITVTGDEAVAAARTADAEIAQGRWRGPLHGIPISLKDLIDQRGVVTTAGSDVTGRLGAAADAPVTAALRAAGAVLVGKTNLHEFAFGTTSDESAFGPVRHPLDRDRSPGGSSGGSAVAVATGMSLASIGTDTGGSIRIPAAACGLVGLKPGLGEVSCRGVVPLSHTLDHVGPLARTGDGCRNHLRRDRGPAGRNVDRAFGERASDRSAPRVLRGCPRARRASRRRTRCSSNCSDTGASLEDVRLPHAAEITAVYLAIVFGEAAALPRGRARESRQPLPAGRTPASRGSAVRVGGGLPAGQAWARGHTRRSRRRARRTRRAAGAGAADRSPECGRRHGHNRRHSAIRCAT